MTIEFHDTIYNNPEIGIWHDVPCVPSRGDWIELGNDCDVWTVVHIYWRDPDYVLICVQRVP